MRLVEELERQAAGRRRTLWQLVAGIVVVIVIGAVATIQIPVALGDRLCAGSASTDLTKLRELTLQKLSQVEAVFTQQQTPCIWSNVLRPLRQDLEAARLERFLVVRLDGEITSDIFRSRCANDLVRLAEPGRSSDGATQHDDNASDWQTRLARRMAPLFEATEIEAIRGPALDRLYGRQQCGWAYFVQSLVIAGVVFFVFLLVRSLLSVWTEFAILEAIKLDVAASRDPSSIDASVFREMVDRARANATKVVAPEDTFFRIFAAASGQAAPPASR